MATLFALADLHLSSSGAKPMDVFGATWAQHADRMAASWDALVLPEDTVLLPGDLSWASDLREARADLEWIASRPGTKLLLRGNHDSWWGSLAKVRESLPPRCLALQNDAWELGSHVIIGARGWTAPDDATATAGDAAIYRREISRLRLSIADADARFSRSIPRVAMLHYPPWIEGRAPTEVVAILRNAGVTTCVYGHLHGADHALGVRGERDGIRFHLVAADYVEFTPVRIAP